LWIKPRCGFEGFQEIKLEGPSYSKLYFSSIIISAFFSNTYDDAFCRSPEFLLQDLDLKQQSQALLLRCVCRQNKENGHQSDVGYGAFRQLLND